MASRQAAEAAAAAHNPAPPALDECESSEDEDESGESEEQLRIAREAREAVERLRDGGEQAGEPASLMDQMLAASGAAKKAQAEMRRAEEAEMDKTFGAGLERAMRANLERRKELKVVVDALREQGNTAFKAGKWLRAAELYGQAVKRCKDDSEDESWYEGKAALHSNRALALLRLDRHEDALREAEAALQLDRKWVKGWLWKAKALIGMNEHKRAGAAFEAGISALGKTSKGGKTLASEFSRLLPEAYEVYAMPVIGARKSAQAAGKENDRADEQPGIVLPEVQEAMMAKLEGGEWANDNLAKLIAANPILSKGMADPRSAVLLKRLQEDPNAAMREYGTSAEARAFIAEMMKVLGQHFTAMGKEDERRQAAAKAQPPPPPPIMTEEEAKLQREADKALQDDRIRSLLEDPETHKVLKACGDPAQMHRYMSDPVWGARLRFMIDNGLLRVER